MSHFAESNKSSFNIFTYLSVHIAVKLSIIIIKLFNPSEIFLDY